MKILKKGIYYYTQSTHTWTKSNNLTVHGFFKRLNTILTKQWACGNLSKSIKNLICSEEISNVLQELSEFKYFINWQNMLFDRSTGTVDHADTWYLDSKPKGEMIAVWIALENINKSAGRFFVYPRSHKLEIKENTKNFIKNHYEYSSFIKSFIEKNKLKKYSPALKKGDVLFWHPNTIHGSDIQENIIYSRKSITAHYHPIGLGRLETAEEPKEIKNYIAKMIPSKNQFIFLDNVDPNNFSFNAKNPFKILS